MSDDDYDFGALVGSLQAWAPLVASGYEVPAASKAMHEAAQLLTRQAARVKELEVAADEVDGFWLKDVTRADKAEASLREAVEVIGWIDAWVSNPVGSYSVSALSGLFSVTRERINAFLAKMETKP